MAAPPLPRTPNAHAGSSGSRSPQTPHSPGSHARELQRIELLLNINVDLLQEINSLQAQGMGGAMSPQHQAQLRAQNMSDKMATEEYISTLRRVQANLAYLSLKADPQAGQKSIPGPAHMTAPPHMARLQAKYERLTELFPDWTGHDRPAQATGSPSVNMMNLTNGTSQTQIASTAMA
jgi:hypothetical protein